MLARTMAPVTALLLVGACVGDEPSAPVETLPDGGVEAGSPEASALPDAAADAADTADAAMPRCDPNKPFGAPALVSGLSTADDDSTARLSADELTVFFARGVAGAGVPDIYTATRASRDAGWGVATMVSGVSSAGPDFSPMVTDDGLTLFLTSSATGTRGGSDIFLSSRPNQLSDFGTPASLGPSGVINTSLPEADPYILPDGKTVWFDVYTGVGDTEIYRATAGAAGFTMRQKVLGVGSPLVDAYPVITLDERTLYFASDRADTDALGDLDLYVATRAAATGPFDPPRILKVLNSSNPEFPTWISRDECVLYLSRRVSGAYDIYKAERPR